jgi:hypothetical protein
VNTTIELESSPGPAFDAVGRLVLGGMGARVGLGIDRITDLQRALDATLHELRSRNTLILTVRPTPDDLHIRLGPFVCAGAGARTQCVQRVLSALVDEIVTQESARDVWIDMRVSRHRLTPAG